MGAGNLYLYCYRLLFQSITASKRGTLYSVNSVKATCSQPIQRVSAEFFSSIFLSVPLVRGDLVFFFIGRIFRFIQENSYDYYHNQLSRPDLLFPFCIIWSGPAITVHCRRSAIYPLSSNCNLFRLDLCLTTGGCVYGSGLLVCDVPCLQRRAG